ncbi:MAG TPA: outer membrane protein assembly factor BamD [Allosphingosinicella sp.]|nr:outer membrane protein assembly factor BamD [Allosphingosinicella sp.]
MRFHLLCALLLAGAAMPAAAQDRPDVEQRIQRLEQQLRAVQRRVFPGGAQVEPEIQPATAQPATRPASGGSAVGDLTARVDALEAQLAALTGQIEENAHRTRQMEAAIARLREETVARLQRLETPPAPAPAQAAAQPAAQQPARPDPGAAEPAAAGSAPGAAAGDPAEEAYNAGFRLWEARRYEEAQTALQAVAERYPRSRWASWASNLAGRAFLDDNKPATAARVLLANYQNNPQGERAADSLYFLGQALVALNRRPEACRVYDELARVYPTMRDWLRQRLPEARRTARCSAAAG